MNYATIKKNDIANGPGIRVSFFVSGCRHHCKNCFNKEAWDFNYGNEFTDEIKNEILDACSPDFVEGLSLLGGEPLEIENQQGILKLVTEFKQRFPKKTIWCYTGFSFENDLLSGKHNDKNTIKQILSFVDVIVDGKFIEEQKDLSLIFRGSANQNIIDVQKSLKENKMILLEGKWKRSMGNSNIYEA